MNEFLSKFEAIEILFFLFGMFLTLVGIVLFIRMGTEGSNSIKFLGFEFKLSGSALVIFVMGLIIFIVPVKFDLGSENKTITKIPEEQNSPEHGENNSDDNTNTVVDDIVEPISPKDDDVILLQDVHGNDFLLDLDDFVPVTKYVIVTVGW